MMSCTTIVKAIREDLVQTLKQKINGYSPVAEESIDAYLIGDIEDANVLIQNSLWLNVPIGQLEHHQQVSIYRTGASGLLTRSNKFDYCKTGLTSSQ
jgi:hypothetical protein